MLWWTAQSLAISAILAGIVWIICRFGRLGPVASHALWLIVLLKLLTPPLVFWPWAIGLPFTRSAQHIADTVGSTAFVCPTVIDQAPVLEEPAIPAQAAPAAPTAPTQTPTQSNGREVARSARRIFSFDLIVRALPVIWLAGAIGLALLQLIRIARMLALVHRGTAPPSTLAQRVALLCSRLRLRRVNIHIVPGLDSPVIWSLARPQLLWPAKLPENLSNHAYDGLILHELAHVRRRDHLVGWLELLAGCIWWWNPLYWYVRHQLRENAELACDGWVTSLLPGGRRAYGEALLNICEFMSRRSAPMPAVGINTGGRRFLERRLAMILRDQVPLRLPRLGLLALGLLATLTLPAWAQKVEERTEATRARPFTSYLSIPPAPPTALPAGAQEVLDQFNREQADIRREAEEKIAQARQRTLDHLKELQDQYTKSGQLDEAVAIRDRVREMESLTSRARQPMEDPGNLTAFRDRVGQTFLFNVVGNSEGTVWGNDVYTDDSPLAAAAVHAGVLKNGERGIVRVTILPGMQSYQGAQRNGITTQSFGPWQGSYRIEPQLHAYREPPTQPIDLMQLRDRVGQTFQYQIVGSDSGTIWGDDVYTDDSPVAVAAVHAGLLRPGQRGVVTIKILPGRENYTGSTRNGVTSQSYLNWDGSYTFVANSAPEPRSYRTREIPGGPRLY